jgi:predicted dehydrogenase
MHARAALEAGKYVFLEKPMTDSYESAKKLFELEATFGERRLFIRHNRRFEAKFLQVREIIDSGILGEVFYIKRAAGSFNYRNDWQTLRKYGGGQLLNWGPHLVDQALIFAGGDYTRMHSVIRQCIAKGDCEDDVRISFLGINGREVEIEISGADAIRPPEYIVYGTRGALVDIDGKRFKLKYHPESYTAPEIEAMEGTPGADSTVSDPNKKAPGGTIYGHDGKVELLEEEREWRVAPLDDTWLHLYAALREGKDYPITSAEALRVMETINEIKRQNG